MTTTAPERSTGEARIAPPASSSTRDQRARHDRSLFARLAADGDPYAREALVERYLPLARSLALRYQRSSEPLDDLMQVASLGLVKAIDGFDSDRPVAFSSYAVPTILGEIKRHFRDRTWAVRVPRGLQEMSARVDRAIGELSENMLRQPSVAEIAVRLGVDEEDVLEALQAGNAYRSVSFETPRTVGDDDAATLADAVGADEPGFERAECRATLATLLAAISPREQEVLRLRFEEDMTQAEIGARVGVSQMQVSRIIRQAITRLRTADEAALAAD
jgi:RNA polymerase sigma-B factor